MSYILDALRRAEALRTRGAVPSLHAPATSGGASAPAAGGRGQTGLVVAVVGLSVLLVALVAFMWWWPGRDGGLRTGPQPRAERPVAMAPPAGTAPAAVPPGPAAVPVPVPPMSAPPQAAAPGTEAPRGPARPPAVPKTAPAPAPAPAAAAARPERAERAERPERPERTERTERAEAVTRAAPRPAAATAASAPRPLPLRAELPADLQRELPALALGGTVYSQDAGQRMVVVNGEVWREGDRLAPGVLVSEIRRKDVVLSFKGQRFVLAP